MDNAQTKVFWVFFNVILFSGFAWFSFFNKSFNQDLIKMFRMGKSLRQYLFCQLQKTFGG